MKLLSFIFIIKCLPQINIFIFQWSAWEVGMWHLNLKHSRPFIKVRFSLHTCSSCNCLLHLRYSLSPCSNWDHTATSSNGTFTTTSCIKPRIKLLAKAGQILTFVWIYHTYSILRSWFDFITTRRNKHRARGGIFGKEKKTCKMLFFYQSSLETRPILGHLECKELQWDFKNRLTFDLKKTCHKCSESKNQVVSSKV